MVFSSLLFLFRFLPIFFGLYLLTPKKMKNLTLFLGSLVFYAWGEPVYVLLMLFSTVSDYFHGIWIEKSLESGHNGRVKGFLISSLVINLAMLGFFKYADFLTGSINGLFGTAIPPLALPLPIGISFYTFQTMSYTIDVYRREVKAQKNFVAFGCFVAMFPQLIAGPIVQYKMIDRQLTERKVTLEGVTDGVRRFCVGLAKKVLLANQAGLVYDTILSWPAESMSVAGTWVGILFFAFQIYFDFSGYSDMAIGLGKMLGFTFPENFRYPYMADSVTDFWRRWHITLGSWFREYVYIPIGGNRKGVKRQVLNLLFVWMLTGIWHGAEWNFLFWGLWFGIWLAAEKLFLLSFLQKIPSVFRHIYAMLLVLAGWAMFSQTEADQLFLVLKAMAGFAQGGFCTQEVLYQLSSNMGLLILLCLGSTPLPARLAFRVKEQFLKESRIIAKVLETAVFGIMFFFALAFLVDSTYNPFLYYRF